MKLASPPPRRILIVRISALGDVVFCTSLLAGLRQAYPQAHIAWLLQSRWADLLQGDSRVDQLIRLPAGATDSLAGARATHRLLRAEPRFDWVIDAQGLLKTRVLARMAPADIRIGLRSREPGAFLVHRLFDKGGNVDDISSEYRDLAQQLTGQDPGPPHLQPTAEQRARALSLLAQQGLPGPYIAFCPYTTRAQKHWMPEHWPQLAQALVPLQRGPCVIFGGPAERDAAQLLHAQLPAGSVNLAGRTPLELLPALLERAALIVGVDTGLTHIGIAVQRPTLALFGSTCPYTRGADSPLRVMYDALPCAPCRRHPTCGGTWDCLRGLTPARVAAAARELLQHP